MCVFSLGSRPGVTWGCGSIDNPIFLIRYSEACDLIFVNFRTEVVTPLFSRVTDSVNVCKRGGIRRKEEVIVSRMKIGHMFLNSTLFILGKPQSGLCSCQEPETVQHVLMSFRKYNQQRQEPLRKLREIGLKEVSLKSILEVGSSRRGKSCFFSDS